MKVVFGVLMMIAALPLLFWNEGRAVRTAQALEEGRGSAVTTSSDKADPGKEGKLVHTTGRARTADTVSDPVFGVSTNAIALKRKVEMYQWTEERESRGRGSDNYVYKYTKQWSASLVDASKFKVPDEHPNPRSMQYSSEKWIAGKVTLGAYTLSPSQVNRIPGADPVHAVLPPSGTVTAGALREHGGALYIGENPEQPQVGDLRITYAKVPDSDVSIVAKQVGSSFAPYRAKSGSTVDLQSKGIVSLDEMFTGAEDANTAAMWGLRVGGFILMAIGVGLMLRPLAAIAGGIPILGAIVGAGTVLIAVLIAAVLSLTTIGLAWIFFRPLLGVALLLVGGAAAYGLWHRIGKARREGVAPDARPAHAPP